MLVRLIILLVLLQLAVEGVKTRKRARQTGGKVQMQKFELPNGCGKVRYARSASEDESEYPGEDEGEGGDEGEDGDDPTGNRRANRQLSGKVKPSRRDRQSSRVVDGEEKDRAQYPAVVQVVAGGTLGFGHCSGVIIHERVVLTARHCVNRLKDIWVMTTVEYEDKPTYWRTEQEYKVAYYCIPIYETDDVAMLVLDKPIPFSEQFQPICIDKDPFNLSDNSKAVGYGLIDGPRNIHAPKPRGLATKRVACKDPVDIAQGERCICFQSTSANNLGSVCGGDSGGMFYRDHGKRPNFVQHLIGIIIEGFGSCQPGAPSAIGTAANASYYYKNFFSRWLDGKESGECSVPVYTKLPSDGT